MNRSLKNLLGICIAVGTAFSAHAQWPDRAIKIVVPYPAANFSDVAARLIGEKLAAQLGLPFAFASHFAPDMLFQALHLYRSNFKPSARLEKPYAMVCINIIAADSNRDAEFLFTSMQQAFVKLRRGETGQLPPPIQNMDQFWSPSEQYGVQQALSMSLVGDKAKVRHGLQSILRETDADEIMVNGQIFDHQARLHSFELAMDVKEELLG